MNSWFFHTPSEVFLARKFAEKIIPNIDNRDFADGRNQERTRRKVFEDNFKGKLAEMFVFNFVGHQTENAKMDFEIYAKGQGDAFDIVTDAGSVDVKASSDRAKCLMVESSKAEAWSNAFSFPQYLCLVSVKKASDGYYSRYILGADYGTFVDRSKLINRGGFIPDTTTPLKADNWVLTEDFCSQKMNAILNYVR